MVPLLSLDLARFTSGLDDLVSLDLLRLLFLFLLLCLLSPREDLLETELIVGWLESELELLDDTSLRVSYVSSAAILNSSPLSFSLRFMLSPSVLLPIV